MNELVESFDAIYSLNVLLHIPPEGLDLILKSIHDRLKTNGLLFYGVYGGVTKQETTTDPSRMNLPRYFSFFNDTDVVAVAANHFDIVHTEFIDIENEQQGLHFQALTLRKKLQI